MATATLSPRELVYKDRIDSAWRSLLDDIDGWHNSLANADTAIRHHVRQFKVFSEKAHDCLMEAYDRGGWRAFDGRITFRSLVVGTLTAQWMSLRLVAHQRLAGSPYQQFLDDCDRDAAEYFQRLRLTFGEEVRSQLSSSPPLVYLGRLAELVFFTRNGPPVLTLPIGAPYDPLSRLALAHEVGHGVFDQLTGFLPELERRVWDHLQLAQPNRQQLVLYGMIMGWLNEIVADLVGTALVGPSFAESAVRLTVSPEATVGIADDEHAVPLVRPQIHLEALDYLSDQVSGYEETYGAEITAFKDHFEAVVGVRFSRRLESIGALTVVTLDDVRNALVNVLQPVLTSQLDVLGGKSVGQILAECATPAVEITSVALPEWGEISEEECQHFVLNLPQDFSPDHAAPAASRLQICCRYGLWICC